jgi:hypothetical protein
MKLASTTDDKAVVSAVANGEEAREPQARFEIEKQLDGSSSESYEHPASERSLLLERLRLEELEADRLINPEDEGETVDVLGEVTDEPGSVETNEAAKVDAKGAPPVQESGPVAQPSAAMQFHWRIGQLANENPEGVQALASTKLEIPRPVLNLLASEAVGADLAIHLVEHPEVVDQLKAMPVERAVRETLEAMAIIKFQAQQAASGQQSQPRKAVSLAPAPIKPLGGGNTKSSLPMDEMNFQDYKRARAAQVKSRYGSR